MPGVAGKSGERRKICGASAALVKILFCSQHFWPENFPTNDLAQALVERGLEVDVLTGKPNYPQGRYYPGYRGLGCRVESWSGAGVFRVPLAARGNGSAMRMVFNYLSFILSGTICAPWLLRGREYSVIFVYGSSPILQALPAILLGRLKRCPVVIWVQDLWPESLEATGYVRNPRILRAVARVVRFIYRRADLLLVQSHAFESAVSRLSGGTPIAYYPNSVDAAFCSAGGSATPEVPALTTGFPVVFAGNIGAAQAMEVIVEAAALLQGYPEIRFVLVGDGVRREWLQREVSARRLRNVSLPGSFPVSAMPALLHQAEALLVTLVDHPALHATVPSKVQTYMAIGRPIVASLNGEGARLVRESAAGLAVPAGDAVALSEAILRLYRMSPAERQSLGANAFRYFEQHFERDRLLDRLLKHFRMVVTTARDGA
jgi:glycosyltransferase involved in cell wall biosynthesis